MIKRDGTKVLKFPKNWPEDKKTVIHLEEEFMIIAHPERAPMIFNQKTHRWKLLNLPKWSLHAKDPKIDNIPQVRQWIQDVENMIKDKLIKKRRSHVRKKV